MIKLLSGLMPSPDKAKSFQAQGVETVVLDLDQPETLEPALQGVDRALLLTGYSVDMLRQSKRFIDAAKQAAVQHLVHIGASGAATNEVAHWGWHQLIEAYIQQQGFNSRSSDHRFQDCFCTVKCQVS